ncbi:hypothetical protein KIW84_012237 [Lathyrus oleraceus]|uniref:Thioredoxin domain-containing protein n=1 Tax=Pisum sativum TaxID=3888 RepID=A0A9D5BH22_PEA|nr:hypothetical protein KIW84_012237 [Pisum sativum]
MIIVDPFWQQHYVYPEEKSFNLASLHGFLSEFLSGTLLPYQLSEDVLQGQREARHPPFVNSDFHEVDSIPRIIAHTFSELVIGFNLSNKENTSNAWNKDVLVLFSNSWCAFCQRMDLIIREVYRTIKGYVDTLNDCHLILKSVNRKEVYPALVLFPAEKKEPLLYGGDVAVIDVMRFLAEHGSNFHDLIRDKVLWLSERVVKNQNLRGTLQTVVHEESLQMRPKYRGVPGPDRVLNQAVEPNMINLPVSSNERVEILPHVVVGSVLIATEKLLGVQPFDGSKILIVAANQIAGFQGLIINKHLN